VKSWFLIALLIEMALICPASVRAGELEILSSESSLYIEVMPHATKWMKAVLEHNTKILIGYSWPDYRKGVAGELRNRSSNLYTSLYDRKKSVNQFFRSATKIYLTIFRDLDMAGLQKAATVCFFDGGKAHPQWPKTYIDLQKLSDMEKLFCLDFSALRSEWYVSYGFAQLEEVS